jgi:Ni,Fe-hydrogenase maturation factor
MKTKKLTIYIFGNLLLDFDNLPIRLLPKLKKRFLDIDFIIQDPNENIKLPQNGELIIIDTVMGIKKVTIIDKIEKLETSKIYSMHDFDLGFNLKLLKKIGALKKIKILGVPSDYSKEETIEELSKIIKILL